MILTDLSAGDVFQLEGASYEVEFISPSGRICMAFNVTDSGKRLFDPNDPIGDTFAKTAISDTRFNREHETQADRDAADVI
jgi:hypothetical protein